MTTATEIAGYDLLALVERYTTLRPKTRGELAGPCPMCGGTDRFLVKPEGGRDGRGIWTCRTCRNFEWSDAIGFAIWRGLAADFRGACEVLRLDLPAHDARPLEPQPPEPCEPPSAAWQDRANAVADTAFLELWDTGAKAREWLHKRGFTDETIGAAGLGYRSLDTFDAPEVWGLPADHAKVFIPRGITIPWVIEGAMWRLNVRRPLTPALMAEGEAKYRGPAGHANGLYGGGLELGRKWPVVLVEGEFDALAVRQAAHDLVNVVALGSTSGARRVRWLARLAACPVVLVALDADTAGEQAAAYWLDALGSSARRWRPYVKDAGEMLERGMDVRGWVEAGIEAAQA